MPGRGRVTAGPGGHSSRGGYVGYLIGGGLGILYIVLLITLGVMALRKGHWVMFIIGIFIPLFWLIGTVMPPVRRV